MLDHYYQLNSKYLNYVYQVMIDKLNQNLLLILIYLFMAFLIILFFGGGFIFYGLVLLSLVIVLLVNLEVGFILASLSNSCITE